MTACASEGVIDMNEAKLKQEIEAYLNENFCDKGSYCSFIRECKEGTRIRCSEFEFLENHLFNFVTPREKENAALKEKLEDTENARDYWKDSSFDWRHKCTSRRPFRAAVKAQKQLTKAVKHLKDLVYVVELGKNELATARILAEVKQFLSEVDK